MKLTLEHSNPTKLERVIRYANRKGVIVNFLDYDSQLQPLEQTLKEEPGYFRAFWALNSLQDLGKQMMETGSSSEDRERFLNLVRGFQIDHLLDHKKRTEVT
jgi:hypothetical protein